jgi:hypothetical protein
MQMTTTRVVLLAATLLACEFAMAQTAPTVYKCTGSDGGVTFSDTPCPSAKSMQKVDTSAALRTGSGGHNQEIAAGVADTNCRNQAQQSAYAGNDAKVQESNSHIADYQQRISKLSDRKVYAADGSGNLVPDPAAADSIAKLNAAISQERQYQQGLQTNSTATYQTAMKGCDDETKKLQKAQKAQKAQESQQSQP